MLRTFWPQYTDCIWHSWIPQANQTIEFESKIVTMNKLNRRFEHSTTSRKKTIIDFKELKIGAAFPGGIHKGCIFLLQFLCREALARVSIHITLHIKCRNTKIQHIFTWCSCFKLFAIWRLTENIWNPHGCNICECTLGGGMDYLGASWLRLPPWK